MILSPQNQKMKHSNFISPIPIFLITLFPLILAQQPYIRRATTACETSDTTNSVLGYTCNGVTQSCQAYLTFRAEPPYNSVSTISTLLSVNSAQLAQLNSVQENTIFQPNRVVLVPVTCSCSGQYYQTNTSYTVRQDDTFLIIANNTFQGLSTCQAIQAQNRISTTNLFPGTIFTVPLRCACPTTNQSNNGVNFLLSYLVTWSQSVSTISARFNVDTGATLEANGLSEQDTTIYPFTTLLVPLQDPPTGSEVTAPQLPPPPVARSPPVTPASHGSSKTWIYVVVGAIGGLVFLSVTVAVVFCVKKRRKNESDMSATTKKFESVEKPLYKKEEDEESHDFLDSLSSIAQSLKVYTYKELKDATEDFSAGFLIKGSVYRGRINGDLAAIKKMNGDVSKEINLLNKINHFNLIRLSGVCFNDGNWYLVYEYASNGQLSDWIHYKSQGKILKWNQRLQIALDVATGLNYLHCYTSPPHVHKDLNGSNVLLDKDLRAKIANFGLARSAEGQEGHFALTRHIVGTKGHMAPEYLENGIVSPKLDVYAFGILLMEILTGKEVSLLRDEVSVLLTEVLKSEENGRENLKTLMDPLLQGNYPPELAMLLFKLIDNCLLKDPSRRPNMDDIFQSLSRISASTLSGEWQISISENHTAPR